MEEIENNLKLFSNFYAETFPFDSTPRFIIRANNTYKI